MLGFDSYATINQGFLGINSVFVAKISLFLCLLASSVAVGYWGYTINKKTGWLAGALIFLSPIWLESFLYFEPEAFAYPFLFLSLAFFFKEGTKNKLIACALIGTASLFWLPGLMFLAPAAFFFWLTIIPAVLLAPIAINNAGYFLPSTVQEASAPGSGVVFHGLLLFFGGIGLMVSNKKALKLVPFVAFFGLLAFLNGKFGVLLAPVLAVFLANAWDLMPKMQSIIVGALVCIVLFSPIAILFLYEPGTAQIEAVKEVVSDANGQTICNDWSYGHMIEYFGGHPIAKAGGLQPDCEIECPGCTTFFYDNAPA